MSESSSSKKGPFDRPMQLRPSPAETSAHGAELFPSYHDVVARREWEIGYIKERLEKNEAVDLPLCRMERVRAGESTVRFGLKRGKLLYVFKFPTHDVERDKHRNVITRARFIKTQLEQSGFRLIPWDFKKSKPPKFWEDETMEEDDDDLYGPSESAASAQQKTEAPKPADDGDSGDEPMDEGLESGEDEDEDDSDSDSDLEIIIDKPPTAPKPIPQQAQESKAIKIEAPPQSGTASSQAPKSTVAQLPTQPGTAYPAVHTSNVDVNTDPVYPAVGKPISQLDIDADLAESTKPWRLPGADQSDYFNYGFDEFTWEMYRQRQQNMVSTLAQQKAETTQFQQLFGMPGGVPAAAAGTGAPSAPTGPAAQSGGGGMPNMGMPGGMNEEMMQQMAQQMMSQGMDPSNMDFNTFMQMAGGFGAPTGPQGGFGGGGGGGQPGGGGGGGGRRGGRGRGW